MSDIEKLNKVIDTLEDQSARVSEFSGVLDSVNSSRRQIESTKKSLASIADEQKLLISESYKNFKEMSKELDKQRSLLSALESSQKNLQKDVATLASIINGASDKQQSAIKSLQMVLIFGLIFVMVGVVVVNS